MVVSLHQGAGQNHNLMTADEFFRNEAKFSYLETTVTNHLHS
jgi:hypothetical protein